MSQPACPNRQGAGEVASRLRSAARDRHHEFWNADLDLLGAASVGLAGVLSSRHVTDLYLLALATHRRGRFVTFDRHVPLAAVPSAESRHLVVLE